MKPAKRTLSEEEKPESFMDIARVCVKKKNKGPFDELITVVYRLRQLMDFYPRLPAQKTNASKLVLLIKQGLRFKNFSGFKQEFSSYRGFEALIQSRNMGEFHAELEEECRRQDHPFEKFFLCKIQRVVEDCLYGISFLKEFVEREMETEEKKLNLLSK